MPMGGLEVLILLVIVLLFFGAKRIPELARSFGIGARELKKAASEEDENQAKKPRKVEAREQRGEKTKPTPQEDARLAEPNPEAEPNPKA
jgi:sec-independent protein translocase protein TatA